MPAVLNMAQSLLKLGQDHLKSYRFDQCLRCLQGALRVPGLSPAAAAEANYLIARIHFQRSRFDQAKQSLKSALAKDPGSADCHYLLAKTIESEAESCSSEALAHYETAAVLAPTDRRKKSAYALKLAKTNDPNQGLQLLEQTYASDSADPEVVSDFVEGLLQQRRMEEAELVVAQASYRHSGDSRFRDLRKRFQQRFREEQLFGKENAGESGPRILPFRNFSSGKPRGGKRPPAPPRENATSPENKPPAVSSSTHRKPESGSTSEPRSNADRRGPEGLVETIQLEPEMTLGDILNRLNAGHVARLYENIGLLGKQGLRSQRSEIRQALMQPEFLASHFRHLPLASRKLLKTLVKAGGFLPASVLFQNTGKDAPPPDYVQPLLKTGILYLGSDASSGKTPRMVAVLPVDLLHRLANLLRIRLRPR